MAGGPPSPAKRSFIDLFNKSSSDSSIALKESSFYRGEPALRFSAEEVAALASSFKFALVGKFSSGRPSMATLRKMFSKIDLKGSIKLGLLDKRHILIRAENEDDFLRFRLRKFWSFEGFVMRIFKWTPDFRTDIESPLVPVWVSFESLPIFMFNKGSLFSLARIIGTPLKIDAATSDLSRPSVARVCVEVDLRRDLPKRIWLDIGSSGFWQPILYEDLPTYCLACSKVGHVAETCVSLKADPQKAVAAPPLPKSKWMPKPVQNQTADPLFSATQNKGVLAFSATDLGSDAAVLPCTIADSAAADTVPVTVSVPASFPCVFDPPVASVGAAVPAEPVPLLAAAVPLLAAAVPVDTLTAALPPAANSAGVLPIDAPTAAAMIVPSHPAAVKTYSAAGFASGTPLLPVQSAVETNGDVDEQRNLDEPILDSVEQPPTSAEDDLPCSSLCAGVLDVASVRMNNEGFAVANSATSELIAAENPAEILPVEPPAAAAMVDLISPQPEAAAAGVYRSLPLSESGAVPAMLSESAAAAAAPVAAAVAESHRAAAATKLSASFGSSAESAVDSAVGMNNSAIAEADVAAVPLVMDSAPKISGQLNPNAPLFNPQIHPFAKLKKTFAEALLDGPATGNVSVEPLFFAVKSAEFPSFQLPQFAEFYAPSSSNLPDDTNCSTIRDDIYTFSDGDDVPRWPASRDVTLNSLQSFHKKLLDKYSKRRRYFRRPSERKKWKKLAPISSTGPAMSSIVPPPLNAITFHGPNPLEDQSDDNASVEYESEWHSSSRDEDNGIDFTIPLASEAAFMALEYEDFSPPARRKYNKRFRDLPAPMTTRSFRNRF